MINNRQQNGRRRGRGGQRPQGGGGNPGRPDGGSRIDNRQRGNANQLYEKYKTLARDAQLSGDRVTTEYYLQFADHYFRVLAENRPRFEEQQQQRARRDEGFEDEFDANDVEEFGAEGEPVRADEYQPQAQAAQQHGREDRAERNDRQPRRERFNGNGEQRGEQRNGEARNGDGRNGESRNGQPAAAPAPIEQPMVEAPVSEEAVIAPRRRGRPPRVRAEDEAPAEATVEADRLPPSLTVPAEGEGDAPRPRRRRARPAAEVEAGQAG